MSLHAVALVRIDPAQLTTRFPPLDVPPGARRGADGAPFLLKAIEDGALVSTLAPFATEPDELARILRGRLGEALELHADPKGVLVFPDVYRPRATGYDALVEEVGELGFRVRPGAKEPTAEKVPQASPARAKPAAPAAEPAPMELPAGLQASLFDLVNALPPGMMAQLQNAVVTGNAEDLAGASAALNSILSARPELAEALGSSLGGLMDAGAPAPDEVPDLPDELEADDLFAQAREHLDRLRESDPEALAELERRLGKRPPR